SGPVTVSPAAFNHLSVKAPSTATAGSGFMLTVTAQDYFGNTVTSLSGPVKLYSSDGQAVTAPSVTLTNGTASLPVTLFKAHTVALTATVTAGNGAVYGAASGLIAVSPSAITVLMTAPSPSTATAGTWFSLTLTAKDIY